MTCVPPCINGLCLEINDESGNPQTAGQNLYQCECFRMWYGQDCSTHWQRLWGQDYDTFYWSFMAAYSALLLFNVFVIVKASKASHYRFSGSRSGLLLRFGMAASIVFRLVERVDATGYHRWYPKYVWRSLNSVGYLALVVALLAFFFWLQDVLHAEVRDESAVLSNSIRNALAPLIVIVLVVDVVVELAMSYKREPDWAVRTHNSIFIVLWIGYTLTAGRTASRLLLMTGDGTKLKADLAAKLQTIGNIVGFMAGVMGGVGVLVGYLYMKGHSWRDPWDTLRLYWVLRSVEGMLIGGTLYSYLHMHSAPKSQKEYENL